MIELLMLQLVCWNVTIYRQCTRSHVCIYTADCSWPVKTKAVMFHVPRLVFFSRTGSLFSWRETFKRGLWLMRSWFKVLLSLAFTPELLGPPEMVSSGGQLCSGRPDSSRESLLCRSPFACNLTLMQDYHRPSDHPATETAFRGLMHWC